MSQQAHTPLPCNDLLALNYAMRVGMRHVSAPDARLCRESDIAKAMVAFHAEASQALRDENRELRAIVEMYRGELSVMADYLDEGEITHARIKAENRVNKTIALIDAALTKGAL
jgi:hypothetical protein